MFVILNEKIKLYECLFNDKKVDLIHWSSKIEEAIQTFVYQYGIAPFQMKYDHKTVILTYEYEDQILERQYQQQQPTDYQVKFLFVLIKLFFFISILFLETTSSRFI